MMTPRPTQPDCRIKNAKREAFSLVELMVGMVILGLGMVLIASIYPVASACAAP